MLYQTMTEFQECSKALSDPGMESKNRDKFLDSGVLVVASPVP